MWQVSLQQYCHDACQISRRHISISFTTFDTDVPKSHGVSKPCESPQPDDHSAALISQLEEALEQSDLNAEMEACPPGLGPVSRQSETASWASTVACSQTPDACVDQVGDSEWSWRGVYWFHLVRLSICVQNRVCSVSSTILARSISYLHTLSSHFRRCVECWFLWQIIKFEILAISLNLHLRLCLLWLGIQYESIVWVIMGWWGVSSECRHSSCSSFNSLWSSDTIW